MLREPVLTVGEMQCSNLFEYFKPNIVLSIVQTKYKVSILNDLTCHYTETLVYRPNIKTIIILVTQVIAVRVYHHQVQLNRNGARIQTLTRPTFVITVLIIQNLLLTVHCRDIWQYMQMEMQGRFSPPQHHHIMGKQTMNWWQWCSYLSKHIA